MQTNHVYYTMLKEGSGNTVNVTDTVTVFYTGSLLKDGSVFDGTKDKPAIFPLSRLIKGWQYALVKCNVGGKVRVYIPSGLAYATRLRSKNIPPNSILVFDIEVIEAKKKI
jgi:FKBP-type peptidyl-prolyl cis-trans isomerase